MEAVKAWGVSTCVVIIVASVVSMIVPNVSGKNVMRLIISGFILAGMLSSFFMLLKSDVFLFDTSSMHSNTALKSDIKYHEKIVSNLEEQVVIALYPLIDVELKKLGVDDEFGLSVDLEEKNDGIDVQNVNIVLSQQHKNDIETMAEKLKENLGLKICIDVIKPEGN